MGWFSPTARAEVFSREVHFLLEKVLVSLANNRLGWKGLPYPNKLMYALRQFVSDEKKSFKTLSLAIVGDLLLVAAGRRRRRVRARASRVDGDDAADRRAAKDRAWRRSLSGSGESAFLV
jgi:hypothetical protein